ncbi:hypothetical protein KQX54_000304, partial [Cotesia glomerata]
TPNPLLRLELGLSKLSLVAYKLILKFLIKILELDDHLLKKCFTRQLKLVNDLRGLIGDTKYNWAASLKETWKGILKLALKYTEQKIKLEDLEAYEKSSAYLFKIHRTIEEHIAFHLTPKPYNPIKALTDSTLPGQDTPQILDIKSTRTVKDLFNYMQCAIAKRAKSLESK